MKKRIINILRRITGRTRHVDSVTFAAMLKAEGGIVLGENCSISPRAIITDPAYVRMGNNVMLSDCALFGHDGSVDMINKMLGTTFDAVGKIVIGDNVFIGHGAIVLHGTTIGNDTIIGAGSVVKGNIPGGFVYSGAPAKQVRTMERHVELLKNRTDELPEEWRKLLRERGSHFDPVAEPKLVELRRKHFFGVELEQ